MTFIDCLVIIFNLNRPSSVWKWNYTYWLHKCTIESTNTPYCFKIIPWGFHWLLALLPDPHDPQYQKKICCTEVYKRRVIIIILILSEMCPACVVQAVYKYSFTNKVVAHFDMLSFIPMVSDTFPCFCHHDSNLWRRTIALTYYNLCYVVPDSFIIW